MVRFRHGTTNKQSLHADERGSITALSYGSPYAPTINRYDEYGKPQPGNIGRFQYTGQMWLGEAGVYHYKARAYSPTFGGRFLQTDPIGYAGGINLYAYVKNDPINWIDPLGLEECPKEGEDNPGDQTGSGDPGGTCDQPDGPDIVVTGIRGAATVSVVAGLPRRYTKYSIRVVRWSLETTVKAATTKGKVKYEKPPSPPLVESLIDTKEEAWRKEIERQTRKTQDNIDLVLEFFGELMRYFN